MEELKIDSEFEKVIPPLTDEEFRQLEENILADGEVLMALIVWNGFIVDGHNRYKIVQKHPEITFRTYERLFDNRYEVIAWICKNQLGRRNLSQEDKDYLIGKRYDAEADSEAFHGNQYTLSDKSGGVQIEHHQNKDKTRARIAKDTNTSESYVYRANQFSKGVDAAEDTLPGIKHEILSGVIKPTKGDIIAIAKAPPEERLGLVEKLRQPKPKPVSKPSAGNSGVKKEPESHDPKIQQLLEISEDMVRPHASVGENDILKSMQGAIHMMMDTCSNYFTRYPKLLSEEQYKVKVVEIMQELKDYITEIEGEKRE